MGEMTEEIEEMMARLVGPHNKGKLLPISHLPTPVEPTVPRKLLLKAETLQSYSEHTGPDWKQLLIVPGDIIICVRIYQRDNCHRIQYANEFIGPISHYHYEEC